MITIKLSDTFEQEIITFLVNESYRLYMKLKKTKLEEVTKNQQNSLKMQLKNMYMNDINHFKIYTVFDDNLMIGCATLSSDGYLRDLYVTEEYQNKGIGSLLIQRIIEDVKEQSEITLNTYYELLEFYKKNGFSVLKEFDTSIMMKR